MFTSSPPRKANRRVRSRRGVYTVEFALTASLLFMTIFACLEFSRFMFVRHSIDQAAFEGARVGVTIGASRTQVEGAARSVLAKVGVADAAVTVTPQTIDSSTMEVTVNVSCSFARNSWMPPRLFGTAPIVSTVTLDHENKAYLTPQVDVGNSDHEPHQTF